MSSDNRWTAKCTFLGVGQVRRAFHRISGWRSRSHPLRRRRGPYQRDQLRPRCEHIRTVGSVWADPGGRRRVCKLRVFIVGLCRYGRARWSAVRSSQESEINFGGKCSSATRKHPRFLGPALSLIDGRSMVSQSNPEERGADVWVRGAVAGNVSACGGERLAPVSARSDR